MFFLINLTTKCKANLRVYSSLFNLSTLLKLLQCKSSHILFKQLFCSILNGTPGVGDAGNQQLVGEQSISYHVSIPAFTIALHTLVPLFLNFEK